MPEPPASRALAAAGKSDEAKRFENKADKFNGLAFNYAYVHNESAKAEARAAQ